MKRPVLASAVVTAVSLIGGMIVGVGIVAQVDRLPFHAPDQMLGLLVSIFIFGGGALWGFLLARIHNFPNRKGALLAGALGFGLAASGAAILLGVLEPVFVQQLRLSLGVPIHIIFTLMFVPATFLVATIGSSAILIVSGNRAHWVRSALTAGAAAALSFLVVDLVLDALGFRVGAPRAVERATMLTVAFFGSAAAAFSAGAILGRLLSKGEGHNPPVT